MIRNKSFINEMVRLYDGLLEAGKKNIGNPITMGFGTWTPSEKGLATIKARRDKIYYGR
tara:strand:+ start:1830 stop:2006 length:177 start_codon:yes stop_codon:yes gene_type:complete